MATVDDAVDATIVVLDWAHSVCMFFWNFRYVPRRSWRIPLIRLRMRLLPELPATSIRYTLRASRKLTCPPQPNAFRFYARLLWPWPRWHYAAVLPAPPRTIMAAPQDVHRQCDDLVRLRKMPLWCARDTAQRSFYRIYEAVCASDGTMTTYEVEYFWRHASPAWATARLRDPQLDCPGICNEQYALLAAVAEALVMACMWRLELGLRRDGTMTEPCMQGPQRVLELPDEIVERCPAWTLNARRLETELVLEPDNDVRFDSPFHRRNIITSTGDFYTV